MGTPLGAPRLAWGDGSPSVSASLSKQAAASPGLGPGVAASSQLQQLYGTVDPAVMEKARPHLTADPDTNRDIIKFYEARARLMQNLAQ